MPNTEVNISLKSKNNPVINITTLSGGFVDAGANIVPTISFINIGSQGPAGPAGASGGGSVGSGEITHVHLATDSVGSDEIINGSVGYDEIQNGAVRGSKIQSEAITTDKILDNAVTQAKLANNSVGIAQIIDGTITKALLADSIVDNDKIEDLTINTGKLQDNVITTIKLKDRNVTGAKIVSNADLDGEIKVHNLKLKGYSPAIITGPDSDALQIKSNSTIDFLNTSGTTIASLDQSGNLTISGTVDGRDIAADGVKLDGISDNEIIDWSVAQTQNIHSSNYTDTNTQLPFIDEDDMASNSSSHVPSQQSVKRYVDDQVAGVVDSAPSTLNTLNELADALGDDENFSTTVTNNIATKAPIASPTFTGTIAIPNITDVESAIASNTAKVGITTSQADAITANTAKPDLTVDGAGTVHANNYTDTQYSVMSSSNSYAAGLVPAGASVHGNNFLRKDGTFAIPYIYLGMDGIAISFNQISVDLKTNGGLVIESGKLALDLGASSITNNLSEATSSDAGLMSTAHHDKLDGIAAGAEVNVNADWNATSGDAQILNKPTIPAAYTDADAVSAVASADNYIKNDTNEVLTGSLEINEFLFINKSGGGSKTRFRNSATTTNRTIDVPDASGTLALTNSLIDTKTAAYWSSSTAGFYITLSGASTSENTSLSTASYTLMYVAPFDGKIKRISSFHQNNASGTSTFEMYIDGDDSDLTNDQRGSDMTTSSFTRKFTEDCPSDWTFSKGEAIAIKRTDSTARYGVTMTIVFEYDTTT